MNPADSYAYNNAKAKASRLRAECYRWEAAAHSTTGDHNSAEHYLTVADQCERRAETWERWAREAPDAPEATMEPASPSQLSGLAARTVVAPVFSTVEPAPEQRSGFHQVTIDRRGSAPQPQPKAEPVCKCSLRTRLVGDGCAVCNPELARELAEDAAPQPQAEPVAWQYRYRYELPNGGSCEWRPCTEDEARTRYASPPNHEYEVRPLYAAPPRPQASAEDDIVLKADIEWLDGLASQAGDFLCDSHVRILALLEVGK